MLGPELGATGDYLRITYSSLVGCVSVRSLCVFEHCLFFCPIGAIWPAASREKNVFHCHDRKNYYLCPSEKQDNQSGKLEMLKGRKAMKGPFDDHVWQLKHTYGTPFLMLVTMVTTPKDMLCARADRASQSGTSQD